ncbi:MAG: SgcJ/EcaC family oxidoreductase [Caulobacterales bacterium]|nr:SgcJ/EcaC family oxidoreductase [Caulobacterales bacterium]
MLLAIALASAVAAVEPGCAALKAQAAPAIAEANADWFRAMKAGDAEALAAAYAEDGVFVGPDGAPVRGRAAVRDLYAARTAKGGPELLSGRIESLGRTCGGQGLVYEWGRGSLTLRTADGRVAQRGGPYLTVWKRLDGRWRIVRNMAF